MCVCVCVCVLQNSGLITFSLSESQSTQFVKTSLILYL